MNARPTRAGHPAGPVQLPITEAEMGDKLREACQKIPGWRCAHFRPGRDSHGNWRTHVQGDGVGFPDWVLAHPRGGILFVELKTARGRMSRAQEEWGEALIRAGGIHRVITGAQELDQFCQELADRATQPLRTAVS